MGLTSCLMSETFCEFIVFRQRFSSATLLSNILGPSSDARRVCIIFCKRSIQ